MSRRSRLRVFLAAGSLLWLGAPPAQALPFPAAFAAAERLAERPADAEAALLDLAEREPPSRFQRLRQEAAYARAAEFALAQGAFDRALEHAGRLRSGPLGQMRALTEMRIRAARGQSRALLEAAEPLDLGVWPEALIYDAAMLRAGAALAEGNPALAETDCRLALRYTLDPARQAQARVRLEAIQAASRRKEGAE